MSNCKCGNPRRKAGYLCLQCEAKNQRKNAALKRERYEKANPKFHRPLGSQRYLITAAQNATPVHERFFATLKKAAAAMDAELVVIPLRYKNPTSIWSRYTQEFDWWDEAVVPYLYNSRKKLNPNLVLAGDVKTQPTAYAPLSGFESLTGAESCIIGHPKMQFRSVPAPSGRFPKILTTTGACTKRNYTDTRAGKLGEFHHVLGALIIEIDGKTFHLRQLNANYEDGSFIDLDKRFTQDGVEDAPPALGLVMGDTHARLICPTVDKATFGKGGIIETLNPKALVFHDVIDGYAFNPHHRNNPFISQAKYQFKKSNVEAEVKHCIEFLRTRVGEREGILVSSNHADFLERWVLDHDWKRDPPNAKFYLKTALAMLESVKWTGKGTEYADPFAYWIEQAGLKNVRCLEPDESYKLGENECGMHGHRGPNGSQGTLENLSRLGSRVISGHTHTPGIRDGHYQCGTSTPLRLEYTHGPSSWLNTHCAVYASGKRALITMIDGAWRL